MQHEAPFQASADHPSVLCGEDQAPAPVEWVLHALAACLTVGIANIAAARNITLHSVECRVEGDIDLQGILGLSDKVRNGYQAIRVDFKVKGDAPQGNRTSKSLDRRIGACPIRAWSTLPIGVQNARWESALDQFVACWEGLEDPRTGNASLHDYHEMLVIALCTVLSGGQGATHMAAFAVAKEPFLRSFLKLEHGLPSHDTFSRLFRRLDPEQFRDCFQRFMGRFADACQGVVAVDGKVLRRSFDKASGKSALHMVSAWGSDARLVLGQIATDAKSNEITAVPKLLAMLSLKGTIVTVDALNCQRAIAQQIIDQGGDYAGQSHLEFLAAYRRDVRPI